MHKFLTENNVNWEILDVAGAEFMLPPRILPLMAPVSQSEIMILSSYPGTKYKSFILNTSNPDLTSLRAFDLLQNFHADEN